MDEGMKGIVRLSSKSQMEYESWYSLDQVVSLGQTDGSA